MSEQIDARGLSCPQPVILAKNALSKGSVPIEIVVDSRTACENVSRMAESNGFTVSTREEDGEYILLLEKPGSK